MQFDIGAIAPGVKLEADGIWHGKSSERVSYPEAGHDSTFAVEDSSFWFQHRNKCIATLANRYPPPQRGPIFDVGGGNGCVTRGLLDAGFDAVLVEPGAAGAMNARKRGVEHVICATTDAASFEAGSLPAVGLFDVIEHIDDDLTFLRSIRASMTHDGMLYATVPAYSALWSDEDDYAGHFRRHTIGSLSAILEMAGFEVQFASYIFRFLPLPILLLRSLPYRLGIRRNHATAQAVRRDHATNRGPGAMILDTLLRSEVDHIAAGQPMRFGGSVLLAARAR